MNERNCGKQGKKKDILQLDYQLALNVYKHWSLLLIVLFRENNKNA
jgi:hypothetical protein